MVNLKRLVTDRRDNLNAFIMSQVTSTENSRNDATSLDPQALADVSRMAGYVDICARLNAKKLAGNPIHLYRPAVRGRAVRGRQAAYLSGKSGVVRSKFNEQINVEDDGFEIVTEHPALEMLRGPNPYLRNGTSLRFVLAYSRQITGNSYAAYFPEENRMYAMNPAYTRIIPNEDDGLLIDRYVYGRDTSQVMTLSPSLVHHQILEADFRQPYKGISWLHSIGSTADLWKRIEDYLSQLMLNHGRPDVLIHFEGHMDAGQWEQMQKSIFGRMRKAVSRATGILMTNTREGSPTVSNLGHAPKDVESIQILDEAERTICNAAGIPETIMRMSDSNLASAKTGEYHWCSNTIMPSAVQEADEWTSWLHEWYPETAESGYFFAPENCVPEDVDRQERIAVQGWQTGILTKNESRALVGYEPVDGGDEFYQQPVQPAIADDPLAGFFGASAETPTLEVTRREDAKVHDPGDECDQIDTTEKPVDAMNTNEHSTDAMNTCGPNCSHGGKEWSQADAYAKTPDSLTGEGEREFKELKQVYNGILKTFDEQMAEILKAMDSAPMGLKGANPRRYTDTKQYEEFLRAWGIQDIDKWAAAMAAATGEAIMSEYAKRAIESLRLVYDDAPDALRETMPDPDTLDPDEWFVNDDRAAKITRRFNDRYAESMMVASRTTADRLANTLSDGLMAGESLGDLQDRVRASFLEGDGVTVSQSRAARIARTEVAQAQTEGRVAGMAGSRVVKGYRFVKANSACPICDAVEQETNGKVFGVEDAMFPKGSSITATDGRAYKFDYQDTIVPIHPNCRCEVRPVLIDL